MARAKKRLVKKAKAGAKRARPQKGKQAAVGADVRARKKRQRDLHERMVGELVAADGDESKERAAFRDAIECYMGLPFSPEDPIEAMCSEYLWDGDTKRAPLLDCVDEVDDETQGRWWRLLIDEERAYAARHGFVPRRPV